MGLPAFPTHPPRPMDREAEVYYKSSPSVRPPPLLCPPPSPVQACLVVSQSPNCHTRGLFELSSSPRREPGWMLIPRLPEHSVSVWSCLDDPWLMFVVLEAGEESKNCFRRGGRVRLKGTCSE